MSTIINEKYLLLLALGEV